jgi:hypothetical protein
MMVWHVPDDIQIHAIPRRIYCNRFMPLPLESALRAVQNAGRRLELRTWDGCFNIRPTRGAAGVPSLHSWGLAIDVNAAWNQLGKTPNMSKELAICFTGAGFDWGGNWSRPDGMHFQLSRDIVLGRDLEAK